MMMEIQFPTWDMHTIVAGLNRLIGSQNMYLVTSSAQNMWTIIVNAHVKMINPDTTAHPIPRRRL